jgi:sugar-phosphatase
MMRSRLAAAGITVPRHAVGGDTVRFGKPNAEGYLRGAAILTRQPQECLVIEDAPAGIRAGKAAGCSVLAVASSHSPEELQEADWIIASIDQISVTIHTETATLNLNFPAILSQRSSLSFF